MCDNKKLSVTFLIDDSASMNPENFNKVLKFIATIAGRFTLSDPYTTLSVVQLEPDRSAYRIQVLN